ncbi:DNA cytosine methyltransferase [Paenibacillus amylolyticus]|uniref:DNA cytosine methyltransferase n=1 Tax=Paenibacillus amylolyticus TaxID=1451 RepID=UPI003EC00D21
MKESETTLNIAEEWRKGYEAGYVNGRIDALDGREYDDRTPLQKRKNKEVDAMTPIIPNHNGYGLRNDERPFAHKIPPGGNWKALPREDQVAFMKGALNSGGGQTMYLRRLAWDEPALTVLASPNAKATCQLHPGKLDVEEADETHNHDPKPLSEHVATKLEAGGYDAYRGKHRIATMEKPCTAVLTQWAKGAPNGLMYPQGKREESVPIRNYNVTPQLPPNGLTVAEFFCGGGLMAVGLKAAGYDITFANDFDKRAAQAYAYNLGDYVVCGDITSGDIQAQIPDADIFAGGPPCQDYSVAGTGAGEGGERGKLVWTYLDIIARKQPKAFVFENVKGLLTKKHRPTFDALIAKFEEIGYSVSWRLVNAWDYGVAQKRESVCLS